MKKFPKQLEMAVEEARKGPARAFRLGAIAKRKDGVIVRARNEKSIVVSPRGHAEARLSRKLTPGCTVFVARISKAGCTSMAKPCKRCEDRLRHVGVKKVIFTTDNGWETLFL